MSYNPSVTSDMVHRHADKPWNWKWLINNFDCFTYDLVSAQPNIHVLGLACVQQRPLPACRLAAGVP